MANVPQTAEPARTPRQADMLLTPPSPVLDAAPGEGAQPSLIASPSDFPQGEITMHTPKNRAMHAFRRGQCLRQS